MNNQEAIEVIKLAQAQVEWEYPIDYAVAFDMAISALQAQEAKHSTEELKQEVKNLTESSLTQKELDTISRQAAIDELYKMLHDCFWADDEELDAVITTLNELPSAQPERKKGKWIEQDDSWDGVYYECSVCKEPFTLIDGTPSDNLYNFCPNCGAYMREDQDE